MVNRYNLILILSIIFPITVYIITEFIFELPRATYYTLGSIIISAIFMLIAKTKVNLEPRVDKRLIKVSVIKNRRKING